MTLYQLAQKVNSNPDTEFYMTVSKNEESTYKYKYYVLFQAHSPLGEDLPEEFEVDTIEQLVKDMKNRADNYNADEHAELYIGMRGKNGVPYCSIRELLEDAEEIGRMYQELVKVLREESKIKE